jgi:hypothetical protein
MDNVNRTGMGALLREYVGGIIPHVKKIVTSLAKEHQIIGVTVVAGLLGGVVCANYVYRQLAERRVEEAVDQDQDTETIPVDGDDSVGVKLNTEYPTRQKTPKSGETEVTARTDIEPDVILLYSTSDSEKHEKEE